MILDPTGRPVVHSNALLSDLPRSVQSAVLKFRNIARYSPVGNAAFFDDWQHFRRVKNHLPEGSVVAVLCHEKELLEPADFAFAGWRTMECLGYDEGWFHFFLHRTWSSNVNVKLPTRPLGSAPEGPPVFLAYFTADEVYGRFALPFLEYHREHYPDARFVIGWYGPDCPVRPDARTIVLTGEREQFSEAHANNAVLQGWELAFPDAGYVLRLDGDTRFSPDAFRKVVYLDTETPSEGLWNLKHDPETGCGLVMARAEVLRGKRYFEAWPAPMYHADTEFLAHLAADHGVVPKVAFLGFDREDHERGQWADVLGTNALHLGRLLLYGRDAVRDGTAPEMAKPETEPADLRS